MRGETFIPTSPEAVAAGRDKAARKWRDIDLRHEAKMRNRAKARKLIAETPRPAWMDDPSLLPKRPPGRAA